MKNEPAFAIIRIDDFLAEPDRFTVTRIVWEEAVAQSEVKRLNELNAEKDSRYVWQATRVERRE
jgi:hypothetical protein